MKKMFCSTDRLRLITTEIQTLMQMENEFISTYVDSFRDGEFYCIITDYCAVILFVLYNFSKD